METLSHPPSETIIIPTDPETRAAVRRAAYPGKMADWIHGWIQTGLSLQTAPDLPPYLITENPDTGELLALHTHEPRCLIRLIETNRGVIAQPLESYQPIHSQTAAQLADLFRGAEQAAADYLADSDP